MHTSSTGRSTSWPATKVSNCRDAGSAHCRSSSTSISCWSSEDCAMRPVIASKSSNRVRSVTRAASAAAALPPEVATARLASWGASSVSRSRRPTRLRSGGSHGQNAGAAPPSKARPHRTAAPRAAAATAASSTSRVLPMPGSPSTSTTRVAVRASSSATITRRSSTSRPTRPAAPGEPTSGVPASDSAAVAAGAEPFPGETASRGEGTGSAPAVAAEGAVVDTSPANSSAGSWLRIAFSRSTSGRPGSMPSWSRNVRRASSRMRSASAWRPDL